MSESTSDSQSNLLRNAAAARPARGLSERVDRRWYPLLAMGGAALIALFANLPFLALAVLLLGRPASIPGPGENTDLFLLLVIGFGPIFLALVVWLHVLENRGLRSLGLRRRGAPRRFARGVGVGALLLALVMGVPLLLGVYRPVGRLSALPALLSIGALLLAWTVQASAEEALTRGFLLPVIGARWGLAAGVGISSVLFAFLHLLNPNVGLAPLINLALFGFFTAFYALAEDGLWGVCAVHAIWNWGLANLFGMPVSGQNLGGSTVWVLADAGPTWLTGGAFGPEGGLIVTAVLAAATAAAGTLWRRRDGKGQGTP